MTIQIVGDEWAGDFGGTVGANSYFNGGGPAAGRRVLAHISSRAAVRGRACQV